MAKQTGLPAKLGCLMAGLLALAAAWASAAASQGAAQSPAPPTWNCHGKIEAGGAASTARELSLTLTLARENETALLGLIDAESGRPIRLAYDAEVSIGSIQIAHLPAQEIVWTREKDNGGDYVGFAVASDGQIASIRILTREDSAKERQFVYFSTEAGGAYRGTCR